MKILTKDFDDYLRDESKLAGGAASEVVFPESATEVARFLKANAAQGAACRDQGSPCGNNGAACSNRGVASNAQGAACGAKITISGARTGIVGGAVPKGGKVLSLERMNQIKEFRYDATSREWVVRVEPGVSLAAFQKLLLEKQLPDSRIPLGFESFQQDPRRFFFPVDATESSASLGGMAATNASGARSFGYGPFRRYVRALEIILADGEVVKIRRGQISAGADDPIQLTTESGKKISFPALRYRIPPVKHTAGFFNQPGLDPIDLFIGSEGLLGAIVELELAVKPEPELWFGGLAFFTDEAEAIHLVRLIRDVSSEMFSLCRPVALEYFDRAALQLFNGTQGRRDLQLPEVPPDAGAGLFFEQEATEAELERFCDVWDAALTACGSSMERVWSALAPKDHLKLKSMRHLVPEAVNQKVGENRKLCPEVHKVGTDLAVPNPYLEELMALYRRSLAEENIPAVIFGHIGNNNLHVNMLPTDSIGLQKAKSLHLKWAEWAVRRGGTVVAEHGLGKLKGQLLRILYNETALAEMWMVKTALDPQNILSPGNVITG
ncbi:MAG TPA: FAD-binding oxidoreductase [Bacillota bacterium]|nr:FAD-binding oxidoreductase [Bacillota bacterium]